MTSLQYLTEWKLFILKCLNDLTNLSIKVAVCFYFSHSVLEGWSLSSSGGKLESLTGPTEKVFCSHTDSQLALIQLMSLSKTLACRESLCIITKISWCSNLMVKIQVTVENGYFEFLNGLLEVCFQLLACLIYSYLKKILQFFSDIYKSEITSFRI